ncbi:MULTISPECIES: hypothetical protein [Leptolyngbya]|uniref:hypothetical protein n=1 Tax=Leptolyngbya TaxID=47251 RepID=UPI0016836757|nr:hypothetical protein [Leptolyngbya sp. FACHB-1624]MBD1855237.1 hypothetical protein [Leptolyngbya sp. FACHB-1624]
MTSKPFEVPDLATFCLLVEQARVGVGWIVYPDIGPGWIGSHREINFYVDCMLVSKNLIISRLINVLCKGLEIPATSADLVIFGEGELRKNGGAIEVVYDWNKAFPYDNPIESGSGVFTLISRLTE